MLERGGAWRDEWVFAITAKDPAAIKVAPAGTVRISNRIQNAEGYLGKPECREILLTIGNFALSLTATARARLHPIPGEVYTHPSFSETAGAKLEGKLFYELHPQVWGQGLASEAFAEVLRFAFEEVGCVRVSADPTSSAKASIALCEKHGMRFARESSENGQGKPQLFHEITRGEWFKRNRGVEGVEPAKGGEDAGEEEHVHGEDCGHDHEGNDEHGHDHSHDEHVHGENCNHDHGHNHEHGNGHSHSHSHGIEAHGHEHEHGENCNHDHEHDHAHAHGSSTPLPPSALVDVGPGPWAGKETCRWCTDFRTRPAIVCRCGWAKYCSRQCQVADWVYKGGHQGECDAE